MLHSAPMLPEPLLPEPLAELEELELEELLELELEELLAPPLPAVDPPAPPAPPAPPTASAPPPERTLTSCSDLPSLASPPQAATQTNIHDANKADFFDIPISLETETGRGRSSSLGSLAGLVEARSSVNRPAGQLVTRVIATGVPCDGACMLLKSSTRNCTKWDIRDPAQDDTITMWRELGRLAGMTPGSCPIRPTGQFRRGNQGARGALVVPRCAREPGQRGGSCPVGRKSSTPGGRGMDSMHLHCGTWIAFC